MDEMHYCNVYIVALSRNMIHIRYSHSPIPNLTTNSQAKILKRGMEIQRIYIYIKDSSLL